MLIEDPTLVDGAWHSIRLISHHRTLQVYVDGKLRGDELDTATAHDFLDPYLIVLTLGGMRDDFLPSNKINHGKTNKLIKIKIFKKNEYSFSNYFFSRIYWLHVQLYNPRPTPPIQQLGSPL